MAIITINGEAREVADISTLNELLAKLQLNAPYLAVAVNDRVIPRSCRADVKISDGDRIEVVHAVGGG